MDLKELSPEEWDLFESTLRPYFSSFWGSIPESPSGILPEKKFIMLRENPSLEKTGMFLWHLHYGCSTSYSEIPLSLGIPLSMTIKLVYKFRLMVGR